MAIEDIQAVAVAVPLEIPTRMATRLLPSRDYVLVWVSTTEGPRGFGYTYAGTSGGALVRDFVQDILSPAIVGHSELDIEGVWKAMYQEALLLGRRGAALRAISAIDIALYDAAAKRAAMSLAALLGGMRTEIPAYASGGYYRDGEDSIVAVASEIEGNRARGFDRHKIKVGGASIAEDAERVRAARAAAGPGALLALDANNAYSTAAEAIEAGSKFEEAAAPEGLWWFEEPLSPDDISGHALVAQRLRTPIATGEIHQTRWDFTQIIDARAAAYLQADAAVVGGVSEWMRIAHLASSFNLPIAPHWHANLHIQLAAATANCLVVEHFELEKDIYNFERLVTPETRVQFHDGLLTLPAERFGLGFDLDMDAVERYRI